MDTESGPADWSAWNTCRDWACWNTIQFVCVFLRNNNNKKNTNPCSCCFFFFSKKRRSGGFSFRVRSWRRATRLFSVVSPFFGGGLVPFQHTVSTKSSSFESTPPSALSTEFFLCFYFGNPRSLSALRTEVGRKSLLVFTEWISDFLSLKKEGLKGEDFWTRKAFHALFFLQILPSS